nr:glycosyltransferase family 4 protein [Microbacterium bovistercoris]
MRIEFLHQNIYGVGGTVRSVINLANALAERHDVTITSVFRRVAAPSLVIDRRIRVRYLVDMRPAGADRGNGLHNRPSRLVPAAEEYFRQYSELTDERIVQHLSQSRSDVIVGTRPSLNLLVAEYGAERATLVAQEHMTHSAIPRTVVSRMRDVYSRLDLITTVTAADRDRVMASLSMPPGRVEVLPNSIPEPLIAPAALDTRLIFGVGRLAQEKRYDLLLEAFALAVDEHPGWRLRLYGDGPARGQLEAHALALGIRELVDFMGAAIDMDSEWPRASITVSTSERESFGMTIVESMRNGVPVISTDCPDGPREIIEDNADGILTPLGDKDAIVRQLTDLMADDERRQLLGSAARKSSQRYAPTRVADTFERLVRGRGAHTTMRSRARSVIKHVRAFIRRRHAASPMKPVRVLSQTPQKIAVTGLPSDTFWKNAAGDRVVLDEHGESRVLDFTAGIWNLHRPLSATRSARVRPTSIDARALVGSPPAASAGFQWGIPYRTFDGYAGLKIWNQPRHSELLSARWVEGELILTVRMAGAWDRDDAVELLLARSATLESPHTIGPRPFSSTMTFSVDTAMLASLWLARSETFHLAVSPAGVQTQAVPLAAVMSDIPDLRRRRVFPERELIDDVDEELFRTTPARRSYARLAFARDNALIIQLSER